MLIMKYEPTKHDSIYEYYTNSGQKRYRVRIKFWHLGVRREQTKQGFKKIAAAQAYKLEQLQKVHAGRTNELLQKKRTLKEHWKSYHYTKVKTGKWNKATEGTNTSRMSIWLEHFGNTPIQDLTRSDVQKVILDLYDYAEKDFSQETIKGYFKIFMQVIDDAVDDDYLEKNRFKKVSYEKPGDWKPKPKTLPLHIYKQFMDLAKAHMRKDIYRCFYLTTFGLRRGEVYGIRSSAIQFLDNNLAKIDINWSRTRDYPEGKTVKSKDSDRFIIVDERATEMLQDQINFARKIKSEKDQVLHNQDYIFLNPETGNPFHIELLNEHMNKIASMIDGEVNVSPHMFRHMFATHASASGVDSLQLRKYLGHADTEMTNHYTHGSEEGAEKVMRLTEKYRS